MPRTPEQFEKIREEKRNQIMDAALELFANGGYHNTSISLISGKAGISKGLMYNYFSSKEDLVKSIFDKGMDSLTQLFDPNKDGVLTAEEFNYFVERTFQTLTENKTYWKLYFGIVMQPGIYEMIKERYEEVINHSLKLLLEYYERQGVEDPMSEAILFGSVMDGISINYLLNPEMFPLEKMKKTLIEKFGHK
ncbi:MAG: TetR/AcrR family transcriptional regulator [Bacteroidota bacterium]